MNSTVSHSHKLDLKASTGYVPDDPGVPLSRHPVQGSQALQTRDRPELNRSGTEESTVMFRREIGRVSDRHHVNAVQDPTFHFNANPDPVPH
jgi:hypothetical protein